MKSNVSYINFGMAPGRAGAEEDQQAPFSPKDYTHEIIEFLRSVHGNIRTDDHGDYYYGKVSTISLHFLLNSSLPPKEVLWGWYDYFDRERSESIYQTLPPFQDEAFLRILEGCEFSWRPDAVRDSGLVFLSRHRKEIYLGLEDSLVRRLESLDGMEPEAQKKWLTPHNTWSESHLRRQIRQLKTRPMAREERRAIYDRLESDYLRATARQLMDEAAGEAFWKRPPPELEPLRARFKALTAILRETSIQLGVYLTKEAYERRGWREQSGEGSRRKRRGSGDRREYQKHHRAPGAGSIMDHFEMLGLPSTATLEEVKTAYREKVKEHHPDQGGTVPGFIQLQEAYEFLLTEVF